MLAAAADIALIDFIVRPFAKIYEKMPILMLLVCLVVYGTIAYFVLRSAFVDQHQ